MSLLEAPFLPKGGSVEVLLSLACSGTGIALGYRRKLLQHGERIAGTSW